MMPPPTAARELIADAALGRGDDHIVPDLTHDTRQKRTLPKVRGCINIQLDRLPAESATGTCLTPNGREELDSHGDPALCVIDHLASLKSWHVVGT